MKKIIMPIAFIVAFLASVAAQADRFVTYSIFAPRYYKDSILKDVSPPFLVTSTGAAFSSGKYTSGENFPATEIFRCNSNLPEGYYVSKWRLDKAWTSFPVQTISTWENQNRIDVSFSYDWAASYGTALDLVVSIDQMEYRVSYEANGGTWVESAPETASWKYSKGGLTPSSDDIAYDGFELTGWRICGASTILRPGAAFTGASLGVSTNSQEIVLTAQWSAKSYDLDLTVGEGIAKIHYKVNGASAYSSVTKSSAISANYGTKWYAYAEPAEGYSYSATSAAKPASGTMGTDGASFAPVGTANSIVVGYGGNGSTGGYVASSTFRYNQAGAIAENEFTREFTVAYNANGGSASEYSKKASSTFLLWADTASGSAAYEYAGGQSGVKNPCGSTGGDVKLYARWKDVSISLPVATRSGYSFAGWYTASAGGTRVGGAGDSYGPVAKSETLYAHWTTNPYQLTLTVGEGIAKIYYKVNGASAYSSVTKSSTVSANYGTKWYAYAEPAEGYSYSATSAVKPASGTMGTDGASFAPVGTVKKVTVHFEGNGGSGTMADMTCNYGKVYNLTKNAYQKTGHDFVVWDCDNGRTYDDQILYYDVSGEDGTRRTMTARWEPKSYAVSKEEVNCTVRVAQSGTYGVALPISWAPKSELGYKYALEDIIVYSGSGSQLARFTGGTNAVYTMTGDYHDSVRVVGTYGKTKEKYSVSVVSEDTNRGTVTVFPSGTLDYGTTVKITATPKAYYGFKNWESTGTPATIQTAEYAFAVTQDVQFRAHFTNVVYVVTFDPNGGTCEETSRRVNGGEAVGALPEALNGAYEPLGWYDDKTAGTRITSSTKITSNLKAYAHWSSQPVQYAITVEANPKEGGAVTGDGSYDRGTTAVICAQPNTGYKFSRWDDGNASAARSIVVMSNVTYTAIFEWAGGKHTMIYAPGDYCQGVAITNFHDHNESVTLLGKSFYRAGYEQTGWSKTADGGSRGANLGGKYTMTADMTFYPYWTANTYDVLFDANGGVGEEMMPRKGVAYGTPFELSYNTYEPTSEAYAFAGWSRSMGGPVEFADMATVSNLTAEANGKVTLYAQWEQLKRYNVQFDPNGGTGMMPGMKNLISGKEYDVPECTFTNLVSYGFDHWEFDDKSYAQGQTFSYQAKSEGETVTWRAVWQDVGLLSKAVGLTNAVLRSDTWKVTDRGESGTSCVTSYYQPLSAGEKSTMSMKVKGPGTLRFNWKTSNWGTFSAKLLVGGSSKRTLSGAVNVWHESVWYVDAEDDSVSDIQWQLSTTFAGGYAAFDVDNVTWTPGVPVKHKIVVKVEGSIGGKVSDGGSQDVCSWVTLTATPDTGYAFDCWTDGVTNNPRKVEVVGDATYTAKFKPNDYTLKLGINAGITNIYYKVNGATEYACTTTNAEIGVAYGTTWYAYAVAAEGYTHSATSEDSPAHSKMTTAGGSFAPSASPNKYDLALTVGDGISKIFYKVNGASAYSSVTKSSTVSANYGTKWYAYAEPAEGYLYSATSAAKPASGTMGTEGASFAPVGTTNSYALVLKVGPGISNICYKVGAADDYSSTTTNAEIGVAYGTIWYAYAEAVEGHSYTETDENNPVSNLMTTAGATFAPTGTPYAIYAAYVGNGATGGKMDVQEFQWGVETNLADNAFKKTGYTFRGWSTNGQDEVVYTNRQSVVWHDDDGTTNKLTAVWKANEYGIILDANGGAGGAVTNSCSYDTPTVLTNSFAKSYAVAFDANGGVVGPSSTNAACQLAGWNSSPDGTGTPYGTTVTNLTAVAGGEVKLYAQWSEAASIILPELVRTGYSFAGWYTQGGEKVTSPYTPMNNITLVAHWTTNTYLMVLTFDEGISKIYYKVNGATEYADTTTNAEIGVVFGTDWAAYAEATNGYHCLTALTNGTMPAANVEFAPKAERDRIYAAYDGNGATEGKMDVQEFRWGVETNLADNAFKKTGYTFRGWSTNSQDEVTYTNRQPVVWHDDDGTTNKLTAVWKANRYTISFDTNGGSCTMTDLPCTYDAPTNLPANAFTRAGHTFAGWESGGVTFADGATVSNLTAEADGTVTLHAQWVANDQTITYASGEYGIGDATNVIRQYGKKVMFKEESENGLAFTRTGYAQDGWSRFANGSGTNLTEYTVTTNETFYPHWAANSYTIHFDKNGADSSDTMDPLTDCQYDQSVTLPTNQYERSHYFFSGWATNETNAVAYSDCAVVSNLTDKTKGSVTLYAVWSTTLDVSGDVGLTNATLIADMGAIGTWEPLGADKGVRFYASSSATNTATLSMQVTGRGVLSFDWKVDKFGNFWTASVLTNGVSMITLPKNSKSYTNEIVALEPLKITWEIKGTYKKDDCKIEVLVKNVRWTPKSE